MAEFTVVGEIHTTELKSESELNFHWDAQILPTKSCYDFCESPLVSAMDQSGMKYYWKLQLEVTHPSSDDGGKCKLMIKYVGGAVGRKSLFAIKFCVATNVSGFEQCVHYDDTREDKTDVAKSQNFSWKPSYEVSLGSLPRSAYRLRILCKIISAIDMFCVEREARPFNQHDFLLKSEFEQLFVDGKFSDVTIVVGNQEFHLHKGILSKRSAVFTNMFEVDPRRNYFTIKDQKYEVMMEFFRYLYAARVNELEKHAVELLKISNKYAVAGLKVLCEKHLIGKLQNQNALQYLNLSSHHNAKYLEARCFDLIVSNAKEIVDLPTFDINSLSRDLRNKIFKNVAKKF